MNLSHRRVLAARVVAVLADAIQLGLMPLFAEGAASIANDVLDVVVAALLVTLVGWHWAFVPAFISELIPVFDLVPTWTAAVLLATRQSPGRPGPPEGPLQPALPESPPALPSKDAPQ